MSPAFNLLKKNKLTQEVEDEILTQRHTAINLQMSKEAEDNISFSTYHLKVDFFWAQIQFSNFPNFSLGKIFNTTSTF